MFADYEKAYKLGKKEYQARMMRGENPLLPVLDDMLPPKGDFSSVPLGLVQIPAGQIVGTKSYGRSCAFAANFMPILSVDSEFALKWAKLSASHLEEGIREPVKAYEYMNRFYIEEGNKRVSVLKYFGAVSVPGEVIRIIPRRTEEKENKIYYEFLDFYELTKINDLWFSREGSFAKLQQAVGKAAGEAWTQDERLEFHSVYTIFSREYHAEGGGNLAITPGDAFLAFILLYDYQTIGKKTPGELRELIKKSWEEFRILEEPENVRLKMEPAQEKKPLISRLISGSPPKLKIAFLYEKTVSSSAWTYAHELGRLHLEQTFPEEVSTVCYENVTVENIEVVLYAAVKAGCNLIFTTTPAFVQASVKTAIQNPEVRILNCSLHTSHRYIRTYYARMHEAKYLMGAIAGAMAENNRLAYVADYPIYGSIANINAFALGAKLTNPRAEVYLEWSSRKDVDVGERLCDIQPSCISGKDMVVPEEGSRFFGIYHMAGSTCRNLAMPLCHWGKFYERLIRTIMDGTWKYDDSPGTKAAINYWWGMSANVVDVILSQTLPSETKRLAELLKNAICSDTFRPFSGRIVSQSGTCRCRENESLSPEQIATMDWLADNVIGAIPDREELKEQAKPVISQQGIGQKKEDRRL